MQVQSKPSAAGPLASLMGSTRLTETAPVHARGIAKLSVAKLNDQELAAIESALDKVTLDCGFG